MGGHGGLNILPQKRWNVYNYENREKVRHDEEQAAREEQLKREQARKRDAEFRLEKLRTARGLAPLNPANQPDNEAVEDNVPDDSEPKPGDFGHINLFEGIKIFDPIKNHSVEERDGSKKKKMKTEDKGSKVVMPEDEKYRLGYGLAGKGVKLPWYLQKQNDNVNGDSDSGNDLPWRREKNEEKRSEKKTLDELRKERLEREKREKERERALMQEKRKRDRDVFADRRSYRKR
ncbi:hypothetical protein L6164_025220 [Bauhinia variegata]|uniref:Uncharacterized protein n=1 Tax=Bauhinia variegata TaxID=167791 RepID=A0ACB9M098_BAUVA|nr:hypothetical protein L6164_025220 [Bauhinia variegata]